MNAFFDFVGPLLGLGAEPKDLTFIQISLRGGVIVFLATLIMIRSGHKRSLARKTAFDSVCSSSSSRRSCRARSMAVLHFFATLGGSVVIVLVHRLLAFIASHSHWFGCLIKGSPEIIVENGDLILPAMRRNHISKHDLEEDLRLDASRSMTSRECAWRGSSAAAISVSSKEKRRAEAPRFARLRSTSILRGNESTIAARTGFLTRSQDRGQNDDRDPYRAGFALPLFECATLASRKT